MAKELDEAAWRAMATGLVTVRDLVRKQRRGCTRAEERAALAKVAAAPAFAGLGPVQMSPHDRGRWIVARVRRRLLDLAAEQGEGTSAALRAVWCWARYIDEGLTPLELYETYPYLVPNELPARTAAARRGRVQSLMWAGGARGDKDSAAGVRLVMAEIRTTLSIDLPGGSRMDTTTFAYEWKRLRTVLPAAHDFLKALAHLAAHPVPLAWLREAGDCLPGLAEAVCANPTELRTTCTALRDRGLVTLNQDQVTVEADIGQHVRRQVTSAQSVHWTAAALRFLSFALPAGTHHHDAWPDWRLGYPHVLAVCAVTESEQINLGDTAYLLDRASVYVRECVEDADLATELSKRAIASNPDDPELHGDCLGNLALAHQAANRLKEAVAVSEQSLTHLATTLGETHESYAESLNVHGNILKSYGQRAAAEEAHARALDIVRDLHKQDPDDDRLRSLLVEALNDHAAELLSNRRRKPDDRLTHGIELLEEASRLVRLGGYGWTQIELNLARAHREAGDLEASRTRLETVRDYCAKQLPGPSTTLVTTLSELAEVYAELDDPRAAATRRAAHQIDNALANALDRPIREGRSR